MLVTLGRRWEADQKEKVATRNPMHSVGPTKTPERMVHTNIMKVEKM